MEMVLAASLAMDASKANICPSEAVLARTRPQGWLHGPRSKAFTLGEDADGETLRRWLAGITGFGGDTASVDGAALLATAQRAAGALVAATSRAATAPTQVGLNTNASSAPSGRASRLHESRFLIGAIDVDSRVAAPADACADVR